MIDIIYELMIHTESKYICDLILNKQCLLLYHNKYLWINKFNNIPSTNYNHREYRRYENCHRRIASIIKHEDEILMQFKHEDILKQFPNFLIQFKNYVSQSPIPVPLSILNILSLTRPICNQYHQYISIKNKTLWYDLSTIDGIYGVQIECDIEITLTKLAFLYPNVDIMNYDHNLTL